MANGPSPTVEEIQLRKRARRRLIGAVTLVAVMVTILPMVLDDEPKPVGQDIAINIPSQQSADFPLKAAKPVVQPASPAIPPQAAPAQPEKPAQAEKQPAPAAKMVEAKPAPAPAPAKKEEKPADKPKPQPAAEKPVEAKPKESKPTAEAVQAGGSYVVMLGAFLSEANAKQRQAKLKELGVKYYLEKIKSPAGEKTGVRAGPYPSRQEAERALARLKAGGIQDGMVAEKK